MCDRKGIDNARFPTVRLQRFQSPEGWMGPIRIAQPITNGTTVFWLVTQIILVPVERQLGGTFFVRKPMRRQIGPIILACSRAWSAEVYPQRTNCSVNHQWDDSVLACNADHLASCRETTGRHLFCMEILREDRLAPSFLRVHELGQQQRCTNKGLDLKYHMMKIRHSEHIQSKQWILKIWQVQHRPLPRSCDTQHCSQIYSI